MRLRRVMALIVLFVGFQGTRAFGQVVSTWNGGTGNWSDPTSWSPAVVPNNGGGATYSVTISAPGSVVTTDLGIGLDNFSMGATDVLNITAFNGLDVNYSGSNYGTINNNGGVNGGGTFTNFGTLNNNGGVGSGPLGTFTNFGTLIDSSGARLFASGVISNSGTLYNSGQIGTGFAGSFGNNGILTNASGGSIFNVNNAGNSGYLSNSGTITQGANYAYFGNSGTISNNSGGDIQNSGDFESSGAFINQNGASLANSDVFGNSGFMYNGGTLSNGAGCGGPGSPTSCGGFFNSGVLINGGLIFTSGTITNRGAFLNAGTITVSNPGLFFTTTDYTQTAGSTLVDGALTATGGAVVNIQGGILGGTGTINGNVLMGGTLMPGDFAPGTLTILGDYEQTGAGILDDLISPLGQSFLNVNGNAMLDSGALLQITLLNGFNPLGQTFGIMDYYSLTGQFVNGTSFWDDGYLWDVTYGQNQIDVTAVQTPEPGTVSLLGIGLIGLVLYSWRNRVCSVRLRLTALQ